MKKYNLGDNNGRKKTTKKKSLKKAYRVMKIL